jgi:hypothetical protein
MYLKLYIFILFALFSFSSSLAQNKKGGSDSISYQGKQLPREFFEELERLQPSGIKEHSPRKATMLSAVLPGLGQAYNKKYWKIPIVYAGLGTVAYLVKWNDDRYQLYKRALFAVVDQDENTVNPLPRLQESSLRTGADFYRRNKEFNMIVFVAVYGLNILDAHIDAHLIGFDINEDLALQVKPHIGQNDFNAASINAGLSLTLKFKK